MTIVRTAGIAAATFAAMLAGSAVASADAADDAFLSYLGEQGVQYSSAAFVTDTARNICAYINSGHRYPDILDQLSGYPNEIALSDTPTFTAAAIATYCPNRLFVLPEV